MQEENTLQYKRTNQVKAISSSLSCFAVAALTGGCTMQQDSPPIADQSLHQQMSMDSRYMMKAFGTNASDQGHSNRIDLADPAQYRFVMNRLAAAGKTAESSPYLFEQLHKTRDQAIAGATGGATTNALPTDRCASFIVLGVETRVGSSIQFNNTRANVSCLAGPTYVYGDITTYNTNLTGTELPVVIQSAAAEAYSTPADLDTVTISPLLPATLGRVNRSDSLVIAEDDLGNQQIIYNNVRSDIVPIPGSILLQHPAFHANVANNGSIEACQVGGSDAECDYRIGKLTGSVFTPFGSPPTGIAAVQSVNPWVGDTSAVFSFAAPFDSNHVYLPTVGTVDVGGTATRGCAIRSIVSAQFHLVKTATGGVCDTSTGLAASFAVTADPRKATFQTVSDFTNQGETASPPIVDCSHASIVNESLRPSLVITALADCGETNPDGSPYLATRVLTLSRDSSPLMRFPIKFLN